MADEAADIRASLHPDWDVQQRQAVLSRKFLFAAYAEVQRFLDKLTELSEREDYYPNLHFAQTHVTVTIQAREGRALDEADFAFARQVDLLLEEDGQQGEQGASSAR